MTDTEKLMNAIPEGMIFLAMREGNKIRPIALKKSEAIIFGNMIGAFSKESPLNAMKECFTIQKDENEKTIQRET